MTLPEALDDVALVDHHAHGIVGTAATLDEFRGLFSESPDARQWPHVASGLTYRRAMRELGALLGCAGEEEAVYAHRRATPPGEYAATLLRETRTEWLLIDDGFPPPGEGEGWERMGELAGARAMPCASTSAPRSRAPPSAASPG